MVSSNVTTKVTPVVTTIYKTEQEFTLTLTAHEVSSLVRSLSNSLDFYWSQAQSSLLAEMREMESRIGETPNVNTHAGRVAFGKANETIMGHLADEKKISAIKEMRDLTNCGLKDAKDAVESIEADQRREAVDRLREKLTNG